MHSCPTARRKTKINLLTLLSLRSCGVPPPFRPTASTHLNPDRLSADYDTTSTARFHAFTALHLGVTSAQTLAHPQRKKKTVIAHHAERPKGRSGTRLRPVNFLPAVLRLPIQQPSAPNRPQRFCMNPLPVSQTPSPAQRLQNNCSNTAQHSTET